MATQWGYFLIEEDAGEEEGNRAAANEQILRCWCDRLKVLGQCAGAYHSPFFEPNNYSYACLSYLRLHTVIIGVAVDKLNPNRAYQHTFIVFFLRREERKAISPPAA